MAGESTVPQSDSNSIEEQDDLLETLYRAHAGALRGRLVGLTRDPAVADDVVGEAFLRLAMALRAGRAPHDPPAWLHRVAVNLVVSRARRNAVATRAMPGLLDHGIATSPEDVAIDHERDELVHEALGTLTGPDRSIVTLAARGYRPEEIAGIIGKTGAATRTRLCRARGRLRTQLELAGLST